MQLEAFEPETRWRLACVRLAVRAASGPVEAFATPVQPISATQLAFADSNPQYKNASGFEYTRDGAVYHTPFLICLVSRHFSLFLSGSRGCLDALRSFTFPEARRLMPRHYLRSAGG